MKKLINIEEGNYSALSCYAPIYFKAVKKD